MANLLGDKFSIEGKSLRTRFTVIVSLLFVQPFFVVGYILYREGLYSGTEYKVLSFLILVIVFGGVVILRQVFDKFVMISSVMRKAEAGEMVTMEVHESARELKDISESFNAIMGRLADTERKLEGQTAELTRAVEDRSLFEKRLIESEERFRIAAECASDLAYEWNISNNTMRYFGRFKEKLSFRPEDLPKTFEEWQAMLHPEECDRVCASLKALIEQNESFSEEYRLKRQDGSYIYVSHRAILARDSEGKTSRVIGALTDITERRRAEAELRLKFVEVERLNKLMVGRELKMEEMKKKMKEIEAHGPGTPTQPEKRHRGKA